MIARATLALALLALGMAAAAEPGPRAVAAKPTIERQLAITIDDLPWASMGEETPPTLAEFHPRLMAALKAGNAPVIGFVNEGKLVSGGKVDTARVHLLPAWDEYTVAYRERGAFLDAAHASRAGNGTATIDATSGAWTWSCTTPATARSARCSPKLPTPG